MKKMIFSTLLISGLVACATSPLGRKQLITMPDSEMNQMGAQAFTDLKQKTQIERDPKTTAYVQCIARNITAQVAADIDPNSWEIVTFRDKQVNAFALPGSKIGVYTGIIPVASTQSQLAAVLGHEVGHVIARHGNERVSQAMAAQVGLSVIGVGKEGSSQWLNLLAGVGTQVGMLKFSRDHESEADIMGLQYMARAGFDPQESVTLWQNIAKAGGKAGPEFLSTHPSNETRISQLQEHMNEAMQLYENARSQGKNPNCTLN